MILLKFELFKEWLQLIADCLDAVEGTNLFIPLIEIGEMRRDLPLVHGNDLVDLTEHYEVNDSEFGPWQVLMLLQLLVKFHNDLIFKLMQPDA